MLEMATRLPSELVDVNFQTGEAELMAALAGHFGQTTPSRAFPVRSGAQLGVCRTMAYVCHQFGLRPDWLRNAGQRPPRPDPPAPEEAVAAPQPAAEERPPVCPLCSDAKSCILCSAPDAPDGPNLDRTGRCVACGSAPEDQQGGPLCPGEDYFLAGCGAKLRK